MRVEQKLTRREYYSIRFKAKKRVKNGSYEQQHGDNEPPKNSFEREGQFVLISRHHFYYFGGNAIPIPQKKFPGLEKRGPGFKQKAFDAGYVARFVKWIKQKKPGVHGAPCMKKSVERRKAETCRSSC